MTKIKLLLFRRANKKLELNQTTNEIKFEDIYASEEEELSHHTSFIENEKYLDDTLGYYCKGLNDEILMIYVVNGEIWLRFNKCDYRLLDSNMVFKCSQIDDDNWVFECVSKSNSFQFVYKQYVHAPWDDEDITDVNFGLFIMLLIKDLKKRNHFIIRNDIKND